MCYILMIQFVSYVQQGCKTFWISSVCRQRLGSLWSITGRHEIEHIAVTWATSWLVFQSTWSDDSSQCWTRLRGWPITSVDPTTSPTRSPASIGWVSLRESSSRSPYWHTKSSTDLLPGYLGPLSHVSPTYPVDDRSVLLAPIAR